MAHRQRGVGWEVWAGGKEGRLTKLQLVLVSGGSGTKREVMAQQGSISFSLTRGSRDEGRGRPEQAEPW